ncbi:MAG: aldose 1-epimerase [Firmicutes bacterium]|nr:aldose 1-epimerase [Bacillota bacterium]
MTASVRQITHFARPALQLQSAGLEALLVPELGGNLLRLQTRQDHIDILRTPTSWEAYEASPNLYGIPVLCPPNRIADGRFTYRDHVYQLAINEPERNNHIHGFAHDKPWRLLDAGLKDGLPFAQIEWRAADFPDVQAQYPHALTLQITYELHEQELRQHLVAINEGPTPAPFGIGFHTTFAVPFGPHGDVSTYQLAVPLDQRFELDRRMLPTGQLQVMSDREQWRAGKAIEGLVLDDVFTSVSDARHRQQAVLQDAASGITVTYACSDPIGFWVLYTRDGHSGFVSVEPYTWVTNAPNLSLPDALSGMRAIASRDSLCVDSAIAISRRGNHI